MTAEVLFICHANVCRSRLMEHEFRAAERAAGPERWRSSSAGVAAVAGNPPCEEVLLLAADSPLGARPRRADRGAVLLDRDVLEKAGLVITATRAERAEVALLDPTMRSRTFTLLEAVALARIEPVSAPAQTGANVDDMLAAFAESLDRHRGSVRLEEMSPRRHWPRRRGGATDLDLDIADAHNRRPRDHHKVLSVVQAQSKALHGQLSLFAGLREPLAN
ncbi:hypothetical protein Q9S78_03030 [Microbacterium sp. KSW-18]|uniref:Phosphotyrosine protein phosphatase I domain-containing protein n=1 Tax=Microbacterium aquilitoris TaxID=3067307 RepID=A0ABU3GG09_9MICO|nr:hypothetical protein [Microbacterium sp. KSW-18]MDT3329637.1 hypothetical protein [Microbacterium sp. KSW-18]